MRRVTGYIGSGKHLIEAGVIPAGSIKLDPQHGRKSYRIPARVFRKLEQSYRRTLSLPEASILAGCHERAIRGLSRAGAFSRIDVPGRKYNFRVEARELAAFVDRMCHLARLRKVGREPRRDFADLVRINGLLSGPAWTRVLRAIEDGQLQLYSAKATPFLLGDLYALSCDVQSFHHSLIALHRRRLT